MMATKEDAGQYVCQVGAVPISHLFQLGTVHLSGRLIIKEIFVMMKIVVVIDSDVANGNQRAAKKKIIHR